MKCKEQHCPYANEDKIMCEKLDFFGINDVYRKVKELFEKPSTSEKT